MIGVIRLEIVDKQEAQEEMVASALGTDADCDGQLNLNNSKSSHRVKINGESVECLYDSGATCCVIKRSLIDESALTGRRMICTLIDGSTRHFPTANILIESEYFTGQIEALVMENPVKPVIMHREDQWIEIPVEQR